MSRDDEEALKVSLAYLAGVLTVAVVLPVCFVVAVRYVPPIRRAVRHGLASQVDTQVRNLSAGGDPVLRTIISGAAAILPSITGEGWDAFVHNHLSNLAADAALHALGAPTGE